MGITRRSFFTLAAAGATGALVMCGGCDSTSTPPHELLAKHVEEEGSPHDDGYALTIPFEEAEDADTSFDSYDEIDCVLTYDGSTFGLEVTRVPPSLSTGYGSASGSYVTTLTLPGEDSTTSEFTHSASMAMMGVDYTSSGSGTLDLSTFDSDTEIEFEEYDPADSVSAGGLMLTFGDEPNDSFINDTHADICGALTSLAAYCAEQDLGVTLADLGATSYEA